MAYEREVNSVGTFLYFVEENRLENSSAGDLGFLGPLRELLATEIVFAGLHILNLF